MAEGQLRATSEGEAGVEGVHRRSDPRGFDRTRDQEEEEVSKGIRAAEW